MVVLATHNIDTLYELWIFLEVLRHFSKKSAYKIIPITTGNSKVFDYFETRINGKTVQFHFNKLFTPEDDSPAWTTGSNPDFTVTVDGKIVAVLDAKNYETKSANIRTEATRTMQGYMMNLQAPMGGLFFPHWSKRFEPTKDRGVLEFSMPIKASWIQMDPSTGVDSMKINSDSIRLLEEQLCEFVS
tara:strand:- start:128 stop:688 length:561 start_codon:yes stop_codon:yes gene_type:complete